MGFVMIGVAVIATNVSERFLNASPATNAMLCIRMTCASSTIVTANSFWNIVDFANLLCFTVACFHLLFFVTLKPKRASKLIDCSNVSHAKGRQFK